MSVFHSIDGWCLQNTFGIQHWEPSGSRVSKLHCTRIATGHLRFPPNIPFLIYKQISEASERYGRSALSSKQYLERVYSIQLLGIEIMYQPVVIGCSFWWLIFWCDANKTEVKRRYIHNRIIDTGITNSIDVPVAVWELSYFISYNLSIDDRPSMRSMATKLDIDADEPVLSIQSRTPSDIQQLSPAAIHRNAVNKSNSFVVILEIRHKEGTPGPEVQYTPQPLTQARMIRVILQRTATFCQTTQCIHSNIILHILLIDQKKTLTSGIVSFCNHDRTHWFLYLHFLHFQIL